MDVDPPKPPEADDSSKRFRSFFFLQINGFVGKKQELFPFPAKNREVFFNETNYWDAVCAKMIKTKHRNYTIATKNVDRGTFLKTTLDLFWEIRYF
jgi:hypothetical protein